MKNRAPTNRAPTKSNAPAQRVLGYSVDRVDVAAGLRELKACGYDEPHTVMVIEHALMRWARGEEEAAQLGAIDESFHGINLTCWIRVIAAARASAEAAAAGCSSCGSTLNEDALARGVTTCVTCVVKVLRKGTK